MPSGGERTAWELIPTVPRSWSCAQQVLAEPEERMGVRSSQTWSLQRQPTQPPETPRLGWLRTALHKAFNNAQILRPPCLSAWKPLKEALHLRIKDHPYKSRFPSTSEVHSWNTSLESSLHVQGGAGEMPLPPHQPVCGLILHANIHSPGQKELRCPQSRPRSLH